MMQAIEESNFHITKAEQMSENRMMSADARALIEAMLAGVKAIQALAFAILATIETNKE